MKKLIVVLILFLPFGALAASPTRVGTDASSAFTNADPWNLAMTVPSTGQNRALVCTVGIAGNNGAPTSVKWNTTETMTQLTNMTGTQQTSGLIYFLANPTATTANVTADWASSQYGFLICATYQDMAQSSPLDTSGQAASASATSLSKEVTTTVNGDVIITWMGLATGASGHNPDAGQSIIASAVAVVGPPSMDAMASDIAQTTAGAITTGFSWTTAINLDLFVAALKYQAPTVASTPADFGYYSTTWW